MSSTVYRSHQTPASHGVWPRFLCFPLFAILGYAGLLILVDRQAWWATAGWVAVLSYCWYCLGGSFHEAAHRNLFRNRWLNEAWGQTLGIIILVPFSAYRVTHRLHHAYLNTPRDYEMWPYSDPTTSRTFRRLFLLGDIVLGVISAPIIYGRVYFKNGTTLTAKEKQSIPKEYLAIVVVWVSIAFALFAAFLMGKYTPKPSHLIFFLPLLISPMISTVRKLIEHLGMASVDPVLGTRTIAGSNWLSNLASYFTFDISVHGPHHRYPNIPGAKLKSKLAAMESEPRTQPIPVFPTYWHAFKDMVPHMWNNPAVGTQQWPESKSTPQNPGDFTPPEPHYKLMPSNYNSNSTSRR